MLGHPNNEHGCYFRLRAFPGFIVVADVAAQSFVSISLVCETELLVAETATNQPLSRSLW